MKLKSLFSVDNEVHIAFIGFLYIKNKLYFVYCQKNISFICTNQSRINRMNNKCQPSTNYIYM